ncbi:MAG TPA: alpha-mannosyltransferase [Gammaproteobacteria bacterium]|nr:alpha-mannosyltransferase [Gammaproteobacteria bacterium]
MKLLLVTDAWSPQVNGVVTTLEHVTDDLRQQGYQIRVIEPSDFVTMALPNYAEIPLALNVWKFGELYRDYAPDFVHIATEGPIGLAARRYLTQHGLQFSSSLHTKFPEYINQRTGVPVAWGYRFLKWFHRASSATLVTTESMRDYLTDRGLKNLVVWGRGVDTKMFHPGLREVDGREVAGNPTLLYVGRVAVEKNIEAFLSLDLPGTKVVVGDGPARPGLEKRFPDAVWAGYQRGKDLAKYYADADVFVFPSKTDTFGIVMLEAMAAGTPVAGYPVTGPLDVVQEGITGSLHDDLEQAVRRALTTPRSACRTYAESQSWERVAQAFQRELVPVVPDNSHWNAADSA